jgi:hypothetical protein
VQGLPGGRQDHSGSPCSVRRSAVLQPPPRPEAGQAAICSGWEPSAEGFGLAPADYEALWAAGRFTAGGKRLCDICPSVVGTVKQPATDHDHRHCGGPTGCRLCVRGLLCSTCNRYLGHIGDDPETGYRLALHLISPLWPKVRNALDDS